MLTKYEAVHPFRKFLNTTGQESYCLARNFDNEKSFIAAEQKDSRDTNPSDGLTPGIKGQVSKQFKLWDCIAESNFPVERTVLMNFLCVTFANETSGYKNYARKVWYKHIDHHIVDENFTCLKKISVMTW